MYKKEFIKYENFDNWVIDNLEMYKKYMKDVHEYIYDKKQIDKLKPRKKLYKGKSNNVVFFLIYRGEIVFGADAFVKKKYIYEQFKEFKDDDNIYRFKKVDYVFSKNNQNIGNIEGVFVNPKYRGKGLCKKGIKILINYLRNNYDICGIMMIVYTNNTPALKCYRKFFKIIDHLYYAYLYDSFVNADALILYRSVIKTKR